MRIVIVLLIVIVGVIGGGFIGGSMVDVPSDRSSPRPTAGPVDRDREMMNALKSFNDGANVMAQRQRNSMIGAGIGAVVGLAAGIFVANKLGKRTKSS